MCTKNTFHLVSSSCGNFLVACILHQMDVGSFIWPSLVSMVGKPKQVNWDRETSCLVLQMDGLDHNYRILSTPHRACTDSHKSKRATLAYQFPKSSESSITLILHIFVIHSPNFEENGSNFEVVINRQTFFRAKRVEQRERDRKIRINLEMMPYVGR